jgi:hypothetical protein
MPSRGGVCVNSLGGWEGMLTSKGRMRSRRTVFLREVSFPREAKGAK